MFGTIHIVDDDASLRTALERRLKKAGYEVATYPSAQQLLDRLPDDNGPGCILLDVRMPGLSGPELQTRLAELGSTLPIIFLSGFADVRTTVKTIKAGAEDFLTKPVTSEQILSAIERAMAHHQSLRATTHRLNALRTLLESLTPREHQVFDLEGSYRIEGRRRLVHEDDFRFDGESTGQAEALLLTSGERSAWGVQLVFHLVPQRSLTQALLYPFGD